MPVHFPPTKRPCPKLMEFSALQLASVRRQKELDDRKYGPNREKERNQLEKGLSALLKKRETSYSMAQLHRRASKRPEPDQSPALEQ